MTAFFTLCLRRRVRLDWVALLAFVCTLGLMPHMAVAQSVAAEVTALKLEREGDALLLSANVKFELPAVVEDALLKGVALIFVAEAQVFRERWYWTNKKVANTERHMRLAYQPLTRRWRLNLSSGVITNAGLGVALNQNFDTLAEALAAVQRLSRWKIADLADLDNQQSHQLEFRFFLDVSQLPRPLQMGTLGQTDWNISASATMPLALEPAK